MEAIMSQSKFKKFQFAEWNSGINSLPGYGLLDEDGQSIGVTVHTMEIAGFNRTEPKQDAEELARFIMRACNSHDALLTASRAMVAHLDKWLADPSFTATPEESKALYDGLVKAIEGTEGKQHE
jgi:hypothetical protein